MSREFDLVKVGIASVGWKFDLVEVGIASVGGKIYRV